LANRSGVLSAALVLALASGTAALAHELLWTRRLIDLLGASAASSTRVFSCFFCGLAVGAAVTPRIVRRLRRPWRAVGLAEAGVGLSALPALYLPDWSGWIWPALGPDRLVAWQGAAVKLGLSILAVFPPAFCMGMVLPLMARALARDRFDLGRHGIWLYAANTLGGCAGLVLVSVVTLHRLGADGSMQAAIAINWVVAASCFILDRGTPRTREAERPGFAPTTTSRRVLASALGISFVSGAGILSYEVVALQWVAISAPLSFYAPTAMLSVVVFVLGLAALLVPWLARASGGPARLVGAGLVGATLLMALSPIFFHQLVRWSELDSRATLGTFLLTLGGVTLGGLGPALFLAGLVFPCVLAWTADAEQDRAGSCWGWLLAVNGIGGLLGAELSYRWLLPRVEIYQGAGVVAACYGLAACGWAWSRPSRTRSIAWAAAATTAVVALIAGPLTWLSQLELPGTVILDQRSGREGLVAVVESTRLGRRIVMSTQYSLGGTALRHEQERLAHVSLMLHPDPQRVMVIGLGTGITPGAVLAHRCVRSLTAVELSPLVVQAADRYFAEFNHEIMRSDRAAVVVEDARTYLASAPGGYDVVVGDLLLPWASGEARLYSLEHFRAARAALRDGGVFCQWLAAYQLTPAHVEIIRETFCRVFPRAYVFRSTFDFRYPALGFVGFRDRELDWAAVRARCDAARAVNDVLDPLVRHVEGLALLYLGTTQSTGGPINTLSNMRVELAAGRDRVTRSAMGEYLLGEAWLGFVTRRWLDRFGHAPDGDLDLPKLVWLGQRLSFLEAVRQFQGPRLSAEDRAAVPAALEEVRRDFPPAILADQGADWVRFPGDATFWLPPQRGPPQ
jgi:spermidine synthase